MDVKDNTLHYSESLPVQEVSMSSQDIDKISRKLENVRSTLSNFRKSKSSEDMIFEAMG